MGEAKEGHSHICYDFQIKNWNQMWFELYWGFGDYETFPRFTYNTSCVPEKNREPRDNQIKYITEKIWWLKAR